MFLEPIPVGLLGPVVTFTWAWLDPEALFDISVNVYKVFVDNPVTAEPGLNGLPLAPLLRV